VTPTNWFRALLGFDEQAYAETKQQLSVGDGRLIAPATGASYDSGTLEIPSLAELRTRAAEVTAERGAAIRVSTVVADVGELHRRAENRHALFQVASQFNLLEMAGPEVTPEDGVTRYAHDRTQGPACAIAAGTATVYRNYCVPVGDGTGQTRDRQIDCLRDVGAALSSGGAVPWTMRNGYALCSRAGLDAVNAQLRACDELARNALRSRLRIGIQWNTQVTSGTVADQFVSQAFCSALPVSYTDIIAPHWSAFARLVLEAAYEATLLAGLINARQSGSNVVYLTELGGGAFGNDPEWIHDAIRRALRLFARSPLDVRLVSYRTRSDALEELARR
jgi:hypothetical protein